jgi:serine/threonine-protein kinase
MLYALLSGRAPFEGDSDLAIVAQVLTEHPPQLQKLNPKLPPDIYPLVDACLDKDVNRRPQSASELRESLLALAPPDEAWLFARVRELTPTESKPSLRVPTDRTPSRPSRSGLARATPVSKATRAQPAEPEETPRGSTLTQPSSSGSSSNKTPMLIAVFGSIIVVCLVALGWLSMRPAPAVEPRKVEAPKPLELVNPVEPVEPVAPKKIELTLKAEPAEAQWIIGDEPACNPCTLSRDQGTQVVAKVSATGFTETELTLDFDQARLVSVTLQPVAVAADPQPTAKPGTRPKPTPKPKPKPGLQIDETNPFLNR